MIYSRWSLGEVPIDLELLVSGLAEVLWERKILRSELKMRWTSQHLRSKYCSNKALSGHVA